MHLPEKIEEWPIDRLKPYEANARTHPKDQITKLVKSIKTYGWTIPVLATSEGEVIAGHGRILAAREAGIMMVPVIVADHLTEEQRQAYRLADNRLTEMADWSETILAEEIQAILREDENVDLESLGFSRAEIDAIIQENTPEAPREIPEKPEKPVVQQGELWHLGSHRLLIGIPNTENIQRLMGDERADLFATAYTPDMGFLIEQAIAEALGDNPAIYLWHTDADRIQAEELWEGAGIFKHQTIIWDKGAGAEANTDYQPQHEPCLYGWLKGNRPFIASHRIDNSTVWQVDPAGEAKPPEIYAIPMRKHVKRGDICFEPFADLGAQIVAGEENGRRVFAIEADHAKAEVIIKRWEGINGEMAEREDGKELGQLQ